MKRKDYCELYGYTLENIPKEYRDAYEGENLEDALFEWIGEEHDNAVTLAKSIVVNNHKFVVRGFTHDSESDEYESYEYVVVGVDLGQVDRYEGTMQVPENKGCSKHLLIKDAKWREIIINNKNVNLIYVSRYYFGIPDPENENYNIIPCVYITQDDCKCCS